MTWPTWDQAAIAAVVCAAVALIANRSSTNWIRSALRSAAVELTLLCFLYSIWRIARKLPLDQPEGAIDRARRLDELQHALHLPSELSLQRLVLEHDWLARSTNYYYAVVHVPALLLFLVWLFVRHRDQYSRWRNGLALLTLFCLVIRFVRVAPPRFLPDLGYVDLAAEYGMSLYGPVGTGVSDQFAAMPSIHVGWAAVVSFGVMFSTTSRWRWAFVPHVVVTELVVSATGNHWWLDGIVAVVLLAVALLIDQKVRRSLRGRSSSPQSPPTPVAIVPSAMS